MSVHHVLIRFAGHKSQSGEGLAKLIRDKTLAELERLEPYALDYTPLTGSPLTKGGMGGYQWCHDCQTWGIPGPFVDSVKKGPEHLLCGNCQSENVVHYQAMLDRREGEVVHGADDVQGSYETCSTCSLCGATDSGDYQTFFRPLEGVDYFLCAACLLKAARRCNDWDKVKPEQERELHHLYASAVQCEDAREFVEVMIERAISARLCDKEGRELTTAGENAIEDWEGAGS